MEIRTWQTDREALEDAFFNLVSDQIGIGVAMVVTKNPADGWPEECRRFINPTLEALRRHLAKE